MAVSAAHELKSLCHQHAPVLTVATAESMTGGRVQSEITAVAGASTFFLGGLTAYTLDQKVRLLGVKRAPAAKVNAVSAEVAAQMACGAARLFGAAVAVATTGYAEPSREHGVEEPFAYWAIAHRVTARRWRIVTGRIVCPGMARNDAQQCVADAVIAELVAYLANLTSKRGGVGARPADRRHRRA